MKQSKLDDKKKQKSLTIHSFIQLNCQTVVSGKKQMKTKTTTNFVFVMTINLLLKNHTHKL